MALELLNLGGYGQFVWPAFIFTFVCCLTLYIKTKKELRKQEKIFSRKFEQIITSKSKEVGRKEISREALPDSSI